MLGGRGGGGGEGERGRGRRWVKGWKNGKGGMMEGEEKEGRGRGRMRRVNKRKALGQ